MPITRALIVINIAIFALQAVYDNALVSIFALWPVGRFYVRDLHTVVGFQPWQLVSYAFLHANLAHIGLNMLALYMFGRDVERTLGAKHYLRLYFAAVVSAAGPPMKASFQPDEASRGQGTEKTDGNVDAVLGHSPEVRNEAESMSL